MRETTITRELEEVIRDCLRGDETLKYLDHVRFQRLLEKSVTNDEFVNQFFNKLVKNNPSLASYLKTGERGRVPNPQVIGTKAEGKYTPQPYNPPPFPTIFRIKDWKEKKGVLTKEIPVNSKGFNIVFELNAPDDYFDRKDHAGSLIVEPPDMWDRRKLIRGTLTLRFRPKAGAKEGEAHPVTVSVTRESDEPLVQKFNVKYLPPVEEPEPEPKVKAPPSGEPPKLDVLGLPKHHLVRKDGWGVHGWTGQDVVKIEEANGDGGGFDIFINMGSDDLRGYITRNRVTSDKKRTTVEGMYEIGILFYSLVSYIELKAKYGNGNGSAQRPAGVVGEDEEGGAVLDIGKTEIGRAHV